MSQKAAVLNESHELPLSPASNLQTMTLPGQPGRQHTHTHTHTQHTRTQSVSFEE